MEVIKMKGLVEKAHGKICQDDNDSVSYRKKDGKMFSMRRCNNRNLVTNPYSSKELACQEAFSALSKTAAAWTSANRVYSEDGRTIDLSASTSDYRKMRAAFDDQEKIVTFQAFVRAQIKDGAVVVPDVAESGTGGSGGSSSTTTTKYTLTLVANPTAGGTVSGGGQYTAGTSVTVTATAKAGYSFSKWSDGNTSASRSVTVNSSQTLTATFVADGEAGGTPSDSNDDGAEA